MRCMMGKTRRMARLPHLVLIMSQISFSCCPMGACEFADIVRYAKKYEPVEISVTVLDDTFSRSREYKIRLADLADRVLSKTATSPLSEIFPTLSYGLFPLL